MGRPGQGSRAPRQTTPNNETEKRLLKTLSRLSQSAIDRTRALLVPGGKPAGSELAPGMTSGTTQVCILPRDQHNVSRQSISRNALKVLNRLHEAGHGGYLVGGGVRDVLVGLKPKDFDVATDASPEEIRALFRNSRIIGRRFRLVHVVFGRDIIEVATFRAAHDKGEGGEVGESGRIVRDNVFGSIEEDALRRDFAVNALYYNIADHSVIDYVGGLDDIEARVFRLIGDPLQRCQEDPVRVLRAVRLAAKLSFDIAPDTLRAMRQTAGELAHTPPPRLFEEVLKLFQGGYAERSFNGVVEHDLLKYLFPLLDRRLKDGVGKVAQQGGRAAAGQGDGNTGLQADPLRTLLDAALANTDRRVGQGKPITPAYLLAFMLWPDVEEMARTSIADGMPTLDALNEAADSVMTRQLRVISIPRRFSGPMREIWFLQPKLELNQGAKALGLLENKRFRAAYDFLLLRASVDADLRSTADWWTRVQNLDPEAQQAFLADKPQIDSPLASSAGEGTARADTEARGPGGRSRGARNARGGGRNGGRHGGRQGRREGGRGPAGDGDRATGNEGSSADAEAVPKPHVANASATDGSTAPARRKRRRRRKPAANKASDA